METGYGQLRQKEVINVRDGRKLGKVTDVIFTFPEGRVQGIVVPDGRGFFRADLFIDIGNVIKIGEDTVLVEMRSVAKAPPPKSGLGYVHNGHSPQDCPPPPPPPPLSPRYFEDDE
ncbi:MAG: YlmC/YmxH family sporulation protein [Clostridia bacterium]|nr:YlmC/YmxH family sporulation protein [Clostridia bacterium]